jgi:HNH endonuclease
MLTQKRLHDILHYDPQTGIFRWRTGKRKGQVAGTRHNERGDLKVSIDNRRYLLHRLAWLWMTGAMPRWDIMHRNGDQSDNSWGNLVEGNRMQHSSTRGHMREPTGVDGVWSVGDRFEATMTTSTALISIGTFGTIDEAKAAIQERRKIARERQRQMMRRVA